MIPKALQDLQKHFQKYPGVGPRQASRYAFFLLKQPKESLDSFVASLQELQKEIDLCGSCYLPALKKDKMCPICADTKRNTGAICVVEKESDALNMEKASVHNGIYFVLGENVSPIGDSAISKNRLKELASRLENNPKPTHYNQAGRQEIILALNNTREGNFTSLYVQELFKKKNLDKKVKLTRLGRGLSTGSELEYSDEETLKNALENRN